jgi:iron(III) transport system permease protein
MRDGFKERLGNIELTTHVVLGLALLILLVFIAYPLSKVILNSFLEAGDVLSLENLTLANFSQFYTSTLYKSALLHTLMVGFLCVLFSCLLGIPMAYFVAKTEVPFKVVFLTLGTLPLILPPYLRSPRGHYRYDDELLSIRLSPDLWSASLS